VVTLITSQMVKVPGLNLCLKKPSRLSKERRDKAGNSGQNRSDVLGGCYFTQTGLDSLIKNLSIPVKAGMVIIITLKACPIPDT